MKVHSLCMKVHSLCMKVHGLCMKVHILFSAVNRRYSLMNMVISSVQCGGGQTLSAWCLIVVTCAILCSWQDALEQALHDHDIEGRRALHEFWQMRVVQYASLLSRRAVELEQACQKKNLVSEQHTGRV